MKKIINLLICLIIASTLLITLGNKSSETTVNAEESTFTLESVKDKCEELTESDVLEGLDPSFVTDGLITMSLEDPNVVQISDFKKYVNKRLDADLIEFSIEQLCLLKIVPIELLVNPGQWYYQGKEYSFFINLWSYENALFDIEYSADIVIIDYDFDREEGSLTSRIDIFSRHFDYYYDETIGFIIKASFKTVFDYVLKDVSFIHQFANEHDFNYFDSEYSKVNDNGSIIRAAQLSYSGIKRRSGWCQFTDIVAETVQLVVGTVDEISGLAYLKNILMIISNGYIKTGYNDGAEIDLYATYDEQKNDSDLPTYIRAVQTYAVDSNNEIFIDDYASFVSIIDDSRLEIRTYQSINFYLYRNSDLISDCYYINENGELLLHTEYIQPSIEASLRYEEAVMFEKNTVANEGVNNGYLLTEESEQTFSFTPTKNGLYDIHIDDEDYGIEIINVQNPVDSNLYELKANQEYIIKVKFIGEEMTSRPYVLNIDFVPETAVLGNNAVTFTESDHEYLALDFSEKGYYTFSAENTNFSLSLYDSDFNAIEENKLNLTVKCENQKYYLKISSTENFTGDTFVTCEKHFIVSFETNTGQVLEDYKFIYGFSTELPTPTVPLGYEFLGWWATPEYSGDEITASNIRSLNQADVLLYAKWRYTEYSVTYHVNGGENVDSGVYTVLEEYTLFISPQKTDSIFVGWYDNPEFNGNKITYIPKGTVGNKEYYAKWVNEKYNVNLTYNISEVENQSITLELENNIFTENSKEVNYGQTFNLPIAKTPGFTFLGWYIGDEQITLGSGESFSNYVYENDITVSAKWSRNSYTIKLCIDENNGYYFLPDGNLINSSDVDMQNLLIEYKGLCPNCMIISLRVNPTTASSVFELLYRPGHIYKYLTYIPNDPTAVACWDTSWIVDAVNEAEIVLYPYYEQEVYTVSFQRPDSKYYNLNDNEYGNLPLYEQNEYVLGSTITYPISYLENLYTEGMSFSCWAMNDGDVFNEQFMPDLSENKEENVTAILYAIFNVDEFIITYDLDGGTFADGVQVVETFTIFNEVSLPVPQKEYNSFGGWYFNNIPMDVISKHTAENINLVADWNPYMYTIKFVSTDKNGNITNTYEQTGIVYNEETVLNRCQFVKEGHRFTGWAITPNGNVVYDDEEIVSNLTTENGGIITLYATWRACIYDLFYPNLPTGATVMVHWYEYGIGLSTMPSIYRITDEGPYLMEQDVIYGWYLDAGFTQKITSISPTQTGNLTLYAKYDYFILSRTCSYETYVINEKVESNPAITFNIDFSKLQEKFEGTGVQTLKIKVSFDYWETYDGYEDVYLYLGNDVIGNNVFDGGDGKEGTSSNPITHTEYFYLSLNNYQDEKTFTVKFGVHGDWLNKWNIENIRVTVYCLS